MSAELPNLTLQPLTDVRPSELAEALTRAFSGYIVDVTFSAAMVAGMIRSDSVDLAVSGLVLQQGNPIAAALIARRGWTSRVAAMGVYPEARGRGVGRWMMETLIDQARRRGERAITLEVIEENRTARRIYESLGFQPVRRLVSYTVAEAVGAAEGALTEIDPREVARALIAYGPADLPWQVSGETLAQAGPPNRGYRLGPAYALISSPEPPQVVLRSLVVVPEERRQGRAACLVRALQAQFPGKQWRIPPLFPEEIAPGLFEKLGFQRESLAQIQMTLPLI